jgi:hypothetical protein
LGGRDRSASLVGIGALLAGTVSVAVVAVDGAGSLGGAFVRGSITVYGPPQAVLAVALVAAGLLLLLMRRREAVGALVGVIGLCAAQLAGAGFVAYRRWPLYWGCCSLGDVTEGDRVRSFALVMAVACAVPAVGCAAVLASKGFLRWHGVACAVAIPAAVVVAVAVPRLLAGGWADELQLASWALMYSLPFATALAVSGLMERTPALAVVGAVACSALLATVGDPFLVLGRPWGTAPGLVIITTAVVAASRLIPMGHRPLANSPGSAR